MVNDISAPFVISSTYQGLNSILKPSIRWRFM